MCLRERPPILGVSLKEKKTFFGLTYEGICYQGNAYWCDGGELKGAGCAAAGLGCGWLQSKGYYYCF